MCAWNQFCCMVFTLVCLWTLQGFELARDKTAKFLDEFKVAQPEPSRELLLNVARCSLRTKVRRHASHILCLSPVVVSPIQCSVVLLFIANVLTTPLTVYVQVHQELADSLTPSVVDAILTIKRPNVPVDIHMVEIMTMQHKSDMDTKLIKG